ncbi:MAG: DNA repair protein RecO [bacterium]
MPTASLRLVDSIYTYVRRQPGAAHRPSELCEARDVGDLYDNHPHPALWGGLWAAPGLEAGGTPEAGGTDGIIVPMADFVIEAIVTGSRRYKETDRLLTLFSREMGRIGAIAKGARKSKSSLSGVTELFVRAKFQIAEGRTLAIVRQAEIIDANPEIREDWTRVRLAGHVAEITNKMSEEKIPDPAVFDMLTAALEGIGNDRADAVVRFKTRLLEHMGVFPDLSSCAKCGKVRVKGEVHLDISNDGFLCTPCAKEAGIYHPVSMKVLHLLHSFRNGDTPDELAEDEIIEKADETLTILLQSFIQIGFKTSASGGQIRNFNNRNSGKDEKSGEK